MNVPNIKLVLEYDGAGFHGWQRQRDLRTVQGELESKLNMILREAVTLTGAGRTDAGSHASFQVANFRTDSEPSLDKTKHALNGLMRGEVVVRDIAAAPEDFHARFSAISRKYRYLIAERPTALMRGRVWVVGKRHDMEAMNEASKALVGEHDFSRFSKKSRRAERNPRCNVSAAAWSRWELGLSFEIEANRFLQGMVRMIVGTVQRIGTGTIPPEYANKIVMGAAGHRAGPAAPAKGLCLVGVSYTPARQVGVPSAREGTEAGT